MILATLVALVLLGSPPARATPLRLLRAYQKNEVAADAKYKTGPVEIVGVIDSIRNDRLNGPYVGLATGELFTEIRAYVSASALASLQSLSKGQLVALSCTVQGMILKSVALKDCSVTWAGDEPPARAVERAKKPEDRIAAFSYLTCFREWFPELARSLETNTQPDGGAISKEQGAEFDKMRRALSKADEELRKGGRLSCQHPLLTLIGACDGEDERGPECSTAQFKAIWSHVPG